METVTKILKIAAFVILVGVCIVTIIYASYLLIAVLGVLLLFSIGYAVNEAKEWLEDNF
jgi:hypothetical protein